jgi:CheY-like chemotaxis protein
MKKYNRILLIDDDDTSNYISEKLIKRLNIGCNTFSLKNGQEAMNFLEEHYAPATGSSEEQTDLIFLDINMPVMDGLEFLEEFYNNKKLKKEYLDAISIYMLTSSDSPLDKEKISKYNVKGYISKPMTEDKLIGIVGR